MADQLSFASLDFAAKKKRTKRDVFLAEMAAVVPWAKLEALIEPHYPRLGPQGGRGHFAPDDAAHYCCSNGTTCPIRRRGSALRHPVDARVAGLELGRDALPDETTILNFRHLLDVMS